jgi:hypothetical protein
MTWAQRLERVFGIEIETCPACGGAVRINACIEGPVVIEKILTHLDAKAPRRGSRWEKFGGVTPMYALTGEPVRPTDGRCRGQSGQTAGHRNSGLYCLDV